MTDAGVPAGAPAPATTTGGLLPHSKLGWAAAVLALFGVGAAVFGFVVGAILNAGGPWTLNFMIPLMGLGVLGGICAVVALVRGDRAAAVVLALVPGAFTVVAVLAEIVTGLMGLQG